MLVGRVKKNSQKQMTLFMDDPAKRWIAFSGLGQQYKCYKTVQSDLSGKKLSSPKKSCTLELIQLWSLNFYTNYLIISPHLTEKNTDYPFQRFVIISGRGITVYWGKYIPTFPRHNF